MNLRQITHKDQLILKQVYFDSINSIDENIYTKEQKFVWASQAWDNVEVDKSLLQGKGWILSKRGEIIGFATRYPDDRLSLFYVRGSSRRKGYGNLILEKVEKEALKTGIKQLLVHEALLTIDCPLYLSSFAFTINCGVSSFGGAHIIK